MTRLPLQHPDSSRVRELRFADCDQLSEMISGGEASFVQLGVGPCQGSMRRIDLDGFYILLTDLKNHTACHVASGKDTRVVHLVNHWTRFLRWNGQDLSRTGVIVWGDSCDYHRVGCDVRTIGLVFDEAKLREVIEVCAPESQTLWDNFDGEMLPDTPEAHRFSNQVSSVMLLAQRHPGRLGSPAIRRQLRERLLIGLIEAAQAPGDPVKVGRPMARERSRIVGLMTDHQMSHPDRPMELTELCTLTGQSARTIAYACQEVLGISPIRYLRMLRLGYARRLLRDAEAPGQTVAETAFMAGFTHLGHFSAAYRSQFGEMPSQTLCRPR